MKSKPFKPMLAGKLEDRKEPLDFPVLASPKIDGIRCLIVEGMAMTRSMKLVPNLHIQNVLGSKIFNGLDGELVVGNAFGADVMTRTSSGVMKIEGEPDFTFCVFDDFSRGDSFFHRLEGANTRVAAVVNSMEMHGYPIKTVPHEWIHRQEDLEEFEAKCLAAGYEGIMIRDPAAKYKYGRSTAKDGALLKVKRFVDSEAVITGYEEEMHNGNEATVNELGRTERSTAQAGLTGKGRLGVLLGKDLKTGATVRCGSGFTAKERQEMWDLRHLLPGMLFTYKFFPTAGFDESPRHPVWKSLRDRRDL
jgi:DNA ligase-1